MLQDVFIMGATGRVGRTLVSQIFDKGDTNPFLHENPTRIVGLSSRSPFFLFNKNGITQKNALEYLKGKSGYCPSYPKRWLEVVCEDYDLNDKSKKLTFIDVTNAEEMLDFHLNVIEATPYGIVTANKNPLSLCDFSRFHRLTRETNRYGYRCSVMAGAEAVNKIRDLKDLGDLITEISGCFSGTLGYITSELEKNLRFSEIVKKAKDIGYTETNPADDLSGKDVAKKLLILSRTAGYDIKVIKVGPLIPKSYLSENNINSFFEGLEKLDEKFRVKVHDARDRGNVLRYVASFKLVDNEPRASVGLREVSIGSPLGSLQGTRNKIVIKTKTYSNDFYSVEAPGAGLEITAQNIRRDLLDQISGRIVNHS